jgi:hypothetical protein
LTKHEKPIIIEYKKKQNGGKYQMKKNFNLFSLSDREQKKVSGGYVQCGCGCVWANCGGSSSMNNGTTNMRKGVYSPDDIPRNESGGIN